MRSKSATYFWGFSGQSKITLAIPSNVAHGDNRGLGEASDNIRMSVPLRSLGSFEFLVGYGAYGLTRVKSSVPLIRKIIVRMVAKRVQPRALRLAAWNTPLRASMKPLDD